MKIALISLMSLIFNFSYSQDLYIPDSIQSEIENLNIIVKKDTINCKVVFPEGHDFTKQHPLALGFSGGDQDEFTVDYCYAAWFRSTYLKDHILIMPINEDDKNLKDYSLKERKRLLKIMGLSLRTERKNWIALGTSNGGIAVFDFIAAYPKRFKSAIVIPGVLSEDIRPTKKWKHLNIALAYGTKDEPNWVSGSEKTKTKLKGIVNNVNTFPLEGQGHILPVNYDLEPVFKAFFEMK